MMRKVAIGLMLSLCALTAKADWQTPDPWTHDQKVVYGAVAVATTLDWLQTRNIARNPHRFRELNPLMGEHPSVGDVDRHFATSAVLGTLALHYLPSKWRTGTLLGLAVTEIGMVMRNDYIGVSARF